MRRAGHRTLAVVTCLVLLAAIPVVVAVVPIGREGRVRPFIVKKGTRLLAIAHDLKADDRVLSEYVFLCCSILLHRGRIVAGEYALSDAMSIYRIAGKMARGDRTLYTLKIVEGYNLYTIGDVIDKARIMDCAAFLGLAHNRAFLGRLGIAADSLEGYLFPDTYFFSKETGVDEFLEKIAQRTFSFLDREEMKKRMAELHMDMRQVLCLASIIEKEAKLEKEKKTISAVFHNRLARGMSLDADPTVIYGLGSFNRDLKKADLAADTPYNTYRLKGLPKGPICSPSKSSIMAALYPEESDMLYFVSRNDGTHVFSKTIQEHNRCVAYYQKRKNRKL
jgi:UPF0755 protein